MEVIELYKKHHQHKDYTSIGLFRAVKQEFHIDKVFYPGSYVHITPSLVFSNVTYADSFRNTFKFFESQEVSAFINRHKEYREEAVFSFYQLDYYKPFPKPIGPFDLVLSQYAGFVGQAVKKYLKKGGHLLCNNSHGDASMAAMDADYELIAVYRRKSDDNFSISNKDLSEYLIPKRHTTKSKEYLRKSMRGIAYTKSPSGYIFKKKI